MMKWYSNLKIGAKLMIGYIIITLLMGVIGVVAISNIKQIETLDTKMYLTITEPLGQEIMFVEAYQRMRNNAKDILMTKDEAQILDFESRIALRNEEFNTNINLFEKTLLTEEGKVKIANIKQSKEKYDAIVKNVIELAKTGQKDRGTEIIIGKEAETIRQAIESDCAWVMNAKIESAKATVEGNQKVAKTSVSIMIALIAVALVVAVTLAIVISRSIKNPILKLIKTSEQIASGDLDTNIDIYTSDEIGNLAEAFRIMTYNVNEAMTNINAASEQVSEGAKQVSDSSISLSQGTTEQASAIEELTASVKQIAVQTKQNADNALVVKEVSEDVKVTAEIGNKKMEQMLSSMADINESSNNISKIIKVIDEIAFQTNILALNAAVEAARAGQHGKGFAVVAEEVRNLAARSANAAKETTDMIESSIKKVEDGTKIANETAVSLEKIVEGVSKATQLINDISSASNEQAIGVEQINQGISQIADVVQTNSATSQETAAASEELSSQADMLKNQVGKFKLKRNYRESFNQEGPYLTSEMVGMLNQLGRSKKTKTNKQNLDRSKIKNIDLEHQNFGKY
ncbi:MAG: methyl-accepting chemotaxis protein [Cellulosilyticaceae bacterium]